MKLKIFFIDKGDMILTDRQTDRQTDRTVVNEK